MPLGRVPLSIYDLPNAIRAVWGRNIKDLSAVTMFNLLPYGRFAVDGYRTMQSPSMTPEFLFKIPLHRIESIVNKDRKQNLVNREIEAMKKGDMMDDQDEETLSRIR